MTKISSQTLTVRFQFKLKQYQINAIHNPKSLHAGQMKLQYQKNSADTSTPDPLPSTSDKKKQSENQRQSEEDTDEFQPPILPHDKYISSTPQHLTFSKDFISQTTGHHKLNLLLKYFNKISQQTMTVSTIDKPDKLNDGETSTMNSTKSNTKQSPLPPNYSDV